MNREQVAERLYAVQQADWAEPLFHNLDRVEISSLIDAVLEIIAGAWRPMTDAPLDGQRVLLWTDTKEGDPELLEYVETICEGEHFALAQIGVFDAKRGWETEKIGKPIAWQPLPLGPAEMGERP